MNFDFSDDEKLIQDQTARYLNDHCTSASVRKVLDGDHSHDAALWQGLADMGLMGTAMPEQYGGVNAGSLALCLVAQELGSHIAPVPFASSIYLASEALLQYGSEAQKSHWLPQLATGAVKGAVAVVEQLTELRECDITCSITAGSDGTAALSGSKLLVADGGLADLMIVLARADQGLGLYLVESNQPGVQRQGVATVDPSSDSASIVFDNASAQLLGAAGEGWQLLHQLYDRAAVLLSFEQLGGAQSALDMAVGYAKERFAFGRAIGSFQGLKHLIADMYVALKLAESNCYYAAWALATDAPELPLAAATARVSATKAYQLCASDNIQVHGGMGFTWEFDCHLYYRRSNYLALMLGGLSSWESKLVDAVAAQQTNNSAAR
ncbi:MAG: acyl-CoA dehydrogenase family protein [Pseudomonadales bacterium]